MNNIFKGIYIEWSLIVCYKVCDYIGLYFIVIFICEKIWKIVIGYYNFR